jgi:hypothetical protein
MSAVRENVASTEMCAVATWVTWPSRQSETLWSGAVALDMYGQETKCGGGTNCSPVFRPRNLNNSTQVTQIIETIFLAYPNHVTSQ